MRAENDNENQKLIKENIRNDRSSSRKTGGKISGKNKKNKKVVKVVEKIKKAGVETLKGDEWEIEGDLVLKKKKVYVLKNENLRLEVIWSHYDVPVARHRERWKTTELVIRNYWWPGVTRDVGRYVEGYDLC